ncbi:hypothetical protein [Oceanomicrobium pacificus]|uniref:Uncharacterized protein n=1 Tax=Oceanomicrobium pacificus TaxID=2692916 RepID=A0A6B0TTE5_9RHOB|nr:hypothetical protein [Oceanomicrobium pacificus]MXU64938.1 hypothetical protein [Oceanomicrobium pacificus]
MSLTLLLPLVIFGITLIVVIVHALGWSSPRAFADEKDAARAWLREFPDDPPQAVDLSTDRRHALLRLPGGGAGIVWSFGQDSVARRLGPGLKLSETETGIDIRPADFTAPRMSVALDAAGATRWQAQLAPLTTPQTEDRHA